MLKKHYIFYLLLFLFIFSIWKNTALSINQNKETLKKNIFKGI